MTELSVDLARAEDDAETINRLSNDLDASFDQLVSTVDREIDAGMNLNWARELQANLHSYRENDMIDATTDMNKSATNIRTIAEEADAYSNERR